MSNYVQHCNVHTSYEEDGEGETLVLLHPELADSRVFEEYVPEFAHHFHVFRPDRRGHGRTPDVEGPITYEQMTRDTIAFFERVVCPAYLLGHSDGATVAQLAVLPGAGHGSLDASIVIDFLAGREEEDDRAHLDGHGAPIRRRRVCRIHPRDRLRRVRPDSWEPGCVDAPARRG